MTSYKNTEEKKIPESVRGMTPSVFRIEVEKELEGHIIPFWKSMRDDTFGGYYGWLDYDLNLDKKAVKGCILNSRIMWFFSQAYRTLGDPSLLAEAKHAYQFMKEFCVDREEGGVFWSVTYDGKPSDTTKHTYNQAFAIYALSTYSEAAQDPSALELAGELFRNIESRMRDDGGYLEAFDRNFQPVSNDKLSENGVIAERTMNTALHVLEAYTEFLRVLDQKDLDGHAAASAGADSSSAFDETRQRMRKELREEVAAKLSAILETCRDKIFNPELGRQEVFFDHEWNSLIDLYSCGHDIESSWLIDRAVDIVGDSGLKASIDPMTDALVRTTYEKAFDGHSMPAEFENGVEKEDRVWWVQAESVNGYLHAWAKYPEKAESGDGNESGRVRYLEAAFAFWDFIRNYIVDKRPGSEWYWYTDRNGVPAHEPIVEPWKCPYHNGRMCMEVMRMIPE